VAFQPLNIHPHVSKAKYVATIKATFANINLYRVEMEQDKLGQAVSSPVSCYGHIRMGNAPCGLCRPCRSK
jgi:7-cyano-7-deazaguanine synthase in queuosine biosynthesis